MSALDDFNIEPGEQIPLGVQTRDNEPESRLSSGSSILGGRWSR